MILFFIFISTFFFFILFERFILLKETYNNYLLKFLKNINKVLLKILKKE